MSAETAKVQTAGGFLRWVRMPHQARTLKNLYRMLDAAEELLSERGFDETSIAEIAREAGSSVGGFYRRFRDKDGLLHALHERFCDEARATGHDAFDPTRWADASLGSILTAFTEFLVEIYRERAGLFRTFLHRGLSDPAVQARTERLFEDLGAGLNDLLATRRDEIGHPDPQAAAAFGLHAVIGTLNHTLVAEPHPVRLADPRFSEELARVFTAYLGVMPDPMPQKPRNTNRQEKQ